MIASKHPDHPIRTSTTTSTPSFLGPLTTSFSAPSTCDTSNTYSVGVYSNDVQWQLGPTNSDDGCMPSNWAVGGYYFPAVCPYGYTNACLTTQGNVETTICCPSYYDFTCYQGEILSNKFGCSYSPFSRYPATLNEQDPSTSTHLDIWAFSVQVQKVATMTSAPIPTSESSDTSLFLYPTIRPTSKSPDSSLFLVPTTTSNLSSLTNPSKTTATTSGTIPTTQTALIESSSITFTNRLSSAAIAGIVAGVIGALALGIVSTFLLMRRKRKQNISPADPGLNHSTPNQQQFAYKPEVAHELGVEGDNIPELEEQRRPSEMPAWGRDSHRRSKTQLVWELPA